MYMHRYAQLWLINVLLYAGCYVARISNIYQRWRTQIQVVNFKSANNLYYLNTLGLNEQIIFSAL